MRSLALIVLFSFCSLQCTIIEDEVDTEKPLLSNCSECHRTLQKEDIQVQFPCNHVFHGACGFTQKCRVCKPLPKPYVINKCCLNSIYIVSCVVIGLISLAAGAGIMFGISKLVR